MKTCFIFNPHSGRNRRRPGFAAAIREFIAARSLDAKFDMTDGPGHATELARAAVYAGYEVVVAVGGDGTMNEVAQGLLNTPAALALVPCGSGNGLALHLGLPRSPAGALRLAIGAGSRVVSVDTGTANGQPFFNAMGLGLDADVSRRFNRLSRRGLPAYARVAWSALRELRSERCVITAGSRSETLDVLLIAVANSDQYGNNARIAPRARVDDGRLDLVAIKSIGLARAAILVPRLFLGTIDQSSHVMRLTGPRFIIDRLRPGLIHTDGETHATDARVEILVQPRSLRVVIPAASGAVAPVRAATAQFALQNPMKLHVRTVILSDIHLGTSDSKVDEVNHFLRHVRCAKLILNGDIIDGWQLRRGGSWTKAHTRFVRIVLKKLEKRGTKVVYLRGNHDDILATFLPLEFENLSVVEDHIHEGPRGRYLVLHGDIFDTVTKNFAFLSHLGDWGYRALLTMNRFYNQWRAWRGKEYWSLSKAIKARVKEAVNHISNFEEHIAELAHNRGCVGVMCGHIHTAADKMIGDVHYLNSGDWVESLTAIVEHWDGRYELISYTDFLREYPMEDGDAAVVDFPTGRIESPAG